LGFDWFPKNQIPLTPFSKEAGWFLSIYFHPHLLPKSDMVIYLAKLLRD
jgi:hypothetical protein